MTAPTRTPGTMLIAGTPWPVYKLVALALGAAVFVLVGVVTMALDLAVLAGAGAAALAWVGLGSFHANDE
jgi:hypothetical protein